MKIIIFYFFLTGMVFSQQHLPKQITFFNFDTRNPSFIQYNYNVPWFNLDSEILFEGIYSDSLTTICLLKYNEPEDTFYQFTELTPVTDSSIIHKKPEGRLIENYPGTPFKIVLWETNDVGSDNRNIAFSVDSGNGWTPYDLLFSSTEDEADPSFVVDLFLYNYKNQFEFLYSKGNSVFLYSKEDTVANDIIFEGNDSIRYSDPAGAYSSFSGNLYVVAVEEKRDKQKLVYRIKNWQNNNWSEISTLFDRVPASKPKFVNIGWGETYLSFEIFAERRNKVLLIRPEDFGIGGTAIPLMADPFIESYDFSSFAFGIITEDPEDDFYTYTPFCFRFKRNDSTYIRAGITDFYSYPFSDFHSKVHNSNPDVGALSMTWKGVLSYTIWEDSSDGKINLFGLKRIDPLGDVKPEGTENKYLLMQNYPNPFNSSTIIRYQLNVRSNVQIKVYDVLGCEVAILVNEEKSPGFYEVEFTGKGAGTNGYGNILPSGIYFYVMQIDKYSAAKKMIYLK